mgnify:CR=1 FL=1
MAADGARSKTTPRSTTPRKMGRGGRFEKVGSGDGRKLRGARVRERAGAGVGERPGLQGWCVEGREPADAVGAKASESGTLAASARGQASGEDSLASLLLACP